MLGGVLILKDEELGEVKYEVLARDSFNDLKLYITATNEGGYKAWEDRKNLFDFVRNPETGVRENPYSDADSYTRRLDIKKANKYKSNITSRDFCIKVAGLIRYIQIAGKQNYNQQVTDFTFSSKREVCVVEPSKKQRIGIINYDAGLITGLRAENAYVAIELHEVSDANLDSTIFTELKEKDKWGRPLSLTPISIVGFKLSSEVLGFTYVPEVEKEEVQAFGMYETIEDVMSAHPNKNTGWIKEREYHIVTDDTLDEVIELFMQHDGLIAYDTETSGLRINFKSRTNEADQLVGVVLSRCTGEGYYFPLQHKLFPNLCNGDHFYFMDKYMRPILEQKKIICHNLKFDWKVAHIYDINVNCVYDTMLALGVTKKYEEDSYEIGLKALTKNIFGVDTFELSDFVMGGSFGNSDIAFWDLPYELVRQYAPADTDWTYALYEYIEANDILNKYEAKKVFEMEVNFAKAVAYSEFYGYHINVEKIPELQAEILGAMEKYKQEMFALAGEEFNPNSPAQLVKIMYDKLKIETIGEKRSTDKETLKALAQKEKPDGSPMYPFVTSLKLYRDNEGIYKNFLKKLPTFATQDGYIFPDVLQIGTTTGRVSVKNPNYQGYNDIVKHYVTPRKDFMHFDSDFAQIEQRVLTSYACIMFPNSEPLSLLKDFDDPDMDYHQYQAARMFNVPYAAVTKDMRQQSKGINFGLPYGMGDESLGTRIFGERNQTNTIKAANLRKKFFQGQELIEQFFEKVRNEGVKQGFTRTQWGRRRYYHKGVFSTAAIRRQAGNHVIQGTAADLYKQSVNNMFNWICNEGLLGKVLINGFIHDEMLIEVHKSINPYYFFKKWREEFEVRPEKYCRLFAGAGVGYCWYDAKKLDLPPLYIQEIIDKYEEDMPWDEDLDKFFADIKAGFKVHKVNRVREYITAEENQGSIIKPAIGALLGDQLGDLLDIVRSDAGKLEGLKNVYGLDIPAEGKYKFKGLQDQLKLFCYVNGLDYTQINIKSLEDVEAEGPKETERRVLFGEDEPFEDDYSDMAPQVTPEMLLKATLQTMGYYVDYEKKTVYMAEMLCRNAGTQVTASRLFIDKHVFLKDEDDFDIVYYPTIKGDNPQSSQIPGYGLTKDGVDSFIMLYTAWKNAGIGVIN